MVAERSCRRPISYPYPPGPVMEQVGARLSASQSQRSEDMVEAPDFSRGSGAFRRRETHNLHKWASAPVACAKGIVSDLPGARLSCGTSW